MKSKHVGVFAILLASAIWAVEPTLARLSFQNADFTHTSTIRAIVAALTSLAILLVLRKRPLHITRKQLPALVYIGLAGTLFADFMYFVGLTQVPIANAVILGHMQPLFIIMLGFVFLKAETLTRDDYLGVGLMVVAGVLVTTQTVENMLALRFGTLGDLIVLSATVAWATCAIVMRRFLTSLDAAVITFYRFAVGAVILGSYLALTGSLAIANIYQVLIGIIVGVGTVLYYAALKRLKAAQVSALELSTPLFAALLGFVVLGELTTPLQIAGMALLFVGVYLLSRE